MNDAATSQDTLAALAEQVARGLAKASMLDGRAFIRTPVLLPSGSTVVVVIQEEGGGRYRVSDLGQGDDEADLLGIVPTYRAQARDMAHLTGLAFDGRAFVAAALDPSRLIGATMAVANATSRALERAMQRAERRRTDAAVDRLLARLHRLFPAADLTRDAELRGASTHPWHFDAVLRGEARQTVFDIVMPHQTSVAFAAAKFHDLARLDHAPARVAVVPSKAAFGDLLAVVAQAAQVIEADAPDRAFSRVA